MLIVSQISAVIISDFYISVDLLLNLLLTLSTVGFSSLFVFFFFSSFDSVTFRCTLCPCYQLSSSHSSQERPKSALERLYSGEPEQQQQRGKMSADEQLERMKRHQKALVRLRKRTLSHGDRHGSSLPRSSSSRPLSADLGSVCY